MKKKISMLLSLVMAISATACLSGCGGGGSAADKDTLVWYTIGDAPAANDEVLAEANKKAKIIRNKKD